jgi:hypothetical protein
MNRERALQVVLMLVGLIFLVGVYPLMMFLWPSGWRWQPHQPEYEQMILGGLRDAGHLPADRFARGASQPHCLYRLVKPGSRGHHDGAGIVEHR